MGKDLAWLCAKVTTSLLFYPPQSVKQHVLVLQGVFWSRAGLIHCNGHYRMPKYVDLINMRHSDVWLRSVKAWVTTENKFQLKNLAHNDLKFGSVSDRNPTMWTIVKAFHSSTTTAQRHRLSWFVLAPTQEWYRVNNMWNVTLRVIWVNKLSPWFINQFPQFKLCPHISNITMLK